MKKILTICICFALLCTLYMPISVSAATSYIRTVNITYNADALICSPRLTEGKLSERVCEETVLVPASSGAELDDYYSCLVYKRGSEYISTIGSTANISPNREYYLRLYLTYADGYAFNYLSLPSVTVNGRNPALVQWFSLTHRSVCVYVRLNYDAETPVATALTLTEHRKMLVRGTSYRFTAVMEGNDAMTWEVKYTFDPATRISSGGVLYIGYDEGPMVLVTVRAKHNPDLFDTVEVYPMNSEPVVHEVTVTDAPEQVQGGHYYYYHYAFSGTAEDTVTWTVSGGNGLSYMEENCLYVDLNETVGTVLTVTVTSTADPTKSDTVRATVAANPTVTAVTITLDEDVLWADNGVSGKEICDLLNDSTVTLNENTVFLDVSYSRLIKAENGAEMPQTTFDNLTVGKNYYLVLNIENEDGIYFNAAQLPAVTVNGTPVARVEWYDDTRADGSVNVYVPFTVHRFGDVNADGTVGEADVAALRSAIEQNAAGNRYDLTRDGAVDTADLDCFYEMVQEISDFSGDGTLDAGDVMIMKDGLFDGSQDLRLDLTLDSAVDVRDLIALKKFIILS